MGYTKKQLEEMFPNKFEFSKFQIDRVAQRNFLTQKVMNVVGMDDGTSGKSQRIAGSKDSEYMLQKNANGWTLALQNENNGVVKIEVDETQVRRSDKIEPTPVEEESDDDDDWETVPIERQPKEKTHELPEALQGFESQVLRNQLYEKLKHEAEGPKPKNSFFVFEDEPSKSNDSKAAEKSEKQDFVSNLNNEDYAFDDFGSSIFTKNKLVSEAKSTDKKEDAEIPKKKKVEVLPPWFIKNGSKPNIEKAENSNDNTRYDEDDELVPFDQLHRAENLPVYVSDNEAEGEKMNPVIIEDLSDDESLKAIRVDSEINSNPQTNEIAINFAPSPTKDFQKSPIHEITDEALEKQKPIELSNQTTLENTDLKREPKDSRLCINKVGKTSSIVSDTSKKLNSPLSIEPSITPLAPKYSEEHENELAEEDYKFAQQEEEELLEQLEKENEENERFAQELNHETQIRSSEDFDVEINALKEQAKKDQRDSDEVTQAMVDECQELLRRFGIPYITAPMEAEAQCAMLMELSLVDGIVTDDSDCFLFGGKRIFKNMFSQNKYVECYDATDLEREFGLDRSKYINLALLLGSDYTDGVTGIGPVTAMEILAEFDGEDSLTKFKEWWENVQLKISQSSDEVVTEFKSKFKKSSATKIFLPEKFPDPDVREAYLHPEVDHDKTPFEWGTPDLDSIRTFMKQMVGWNDDRTDQVLVPVIKDMNRKIQEAKQSTINDFFLKVPTKTTHTGTAKSSRMKKAMERLGEKHKIQRTKKRTLDEAGSESHRANSLKYQKAAK